MKTQPTIVLLTLCFLSLGRVAADTITEPLLDTGLLTTDLTNVPLNFQLFDSNLGTLTGVSLTITGEMKASGTVTNTAANPQSFSFKQDVGYTLTDSGGPLDPTLSTITPDPSKTQTYTNLASNTSSPYGPFDVTASSTTNSFGSLAPFEAPGGGTDTVLVSTLTGDTFIGGGGNITQDVTTQGDATIEVIYTYTPVPEASSLLLMGGLLGGFCMVRRRTV